MTFEDFISHCTACGGNWTAMILTGIKDVVPDLYERMPDRSYSFDEVCFIANHLCHDRPHLRYNFSIETNRVLEYTPRGDLIDRAPTAEELHMTPKEFDVKMNGLKEEDLCSCKGCLDYDDCTYHEPNAYTPHREDGSIGCPYVNTEEVKSND